MGLFLHLMLLSLFLICHASNHHLLPQQLFVAFQLRREMEAIAADKNKLSMEGLLKLEEKMTRVQTGNFLYVRRETYFKGLYHEKKDLQAKISGLDDSESQRRLQSQMGKLDALEVCNSGCFFLKYFQGDMDKTSERIRDKVERQIPQDVSFSLLH